MTYLWVLFGTIGIGCIQLQNSFLDAALGNLGNVRLVLPLGYKLVNIFHADVDVIARQQTAHPTINPTRIKLNILYCGSIADFERSINTFDFSGFLKDFKIILQYCSSVIITELLCYLVTSSAFIPFILFIFLANEANSQASTQTFISREHNSLQQTSWQRRYFKKKSCFPLKGQGQLLKQICRLFRIANDIGGAFSNHLNQFNGLVVPDSRRFIFILYFCYWSRKWMTKLFTADRVIYIHSSKFIRSPCQLWCISLCSGYHGKLSDGSLF